MSENNIEEAPKIEVARRPWRRSLLLGFVILLCGGAIGSVITGVTIERRPERGSRRPERVPEKIAERMQEKYGLTDDQTQKILVVMQEHGKKLSDIRAEVQPRIDAEHEALRIAVEAVLTPEQATRWREEFEQMRGPWHRSGGESSPSAACPPKT